MSERKHRGTRSMLDGTGFYIALFLGVTALAVTGYWMLLPSPAEVESAAKPQELPLPIVIEPTEPVIPEVKDEPAPIEPVSRPVEIIEPKKPTPTPVAPTLIVSPLTGETLTAFSVAELLYSETLCDWRTHDGIDIAAAPGTQVLAACSGTVLSVADDDLMGTTVVIDHGGGFETVYANLQSVPTVAPEQYVSAGQVIGSVGETAIAESAVAPHLHFAVTKDGKPFDPTDFLKK
ncbi:MAG: peptidoglycan DD-metalloendopeptidase family protein [Oscillospiraceae bacterium]|nr:peptidoglycan DD-metalloendopeptidase family protein [Oscillospiraceae bacterium]